MDNNLVSETWMMRGLECGWMGTWNSHEVADPRGEGLMSSPSRMQRGVSIVVGR